MYVREGERVRVEKKGGRESYEEYGGGKVATRSVREP